MEKRDNRKNGFTLIELMIVVAIIGILSALAIPDFTKLMIKAKQSEARTNLGAIYTCQMVYFATANQYAGGPNAFNLVNWRPESALVMKYTYVLDEDVMPGGFGTSGLPSGVPSTNQAFLAIAIANLDHDPSPDIMTVNQYRQITNMVNDVIY